MSNGGTLPIGPGIWGFIAFFLLAIALWLLVRNMNSRLRRMAYREREQADADALTTPENGDETVSSENGSRPVDGNQPLDDHQRLDGNQP
jgi:hypothetical protein